MKHLAFLFILSLSVSCGDSEDTATCYSFDERQCSTDPWVPLDGLPFSLESVVTDYLSDQNIEISRILIDPDFHEAVCEACTVCPSGKRIYVDLDTEDISNIEALNLLNGETADCDVFN